MFTIFALAANTKPTYPTFKATIMYSMPWANNTQFADVAYDAVSQRIKYAFYNNSKSYCDITIGFADSQIYGRTAQNHYECFNYDNTSFNETYIAFVPDLTNFTEMPMQWVNGVQCNHYRLRGDYVENQSDPYNYTESRIYQQDFWCQMDNKTHQCTPLKWYMNSKSNFNSHYNIYQIEYANFTYSVSDGDFFLASFYNASCPDQPENYSESAPKPYKSFFSAMTVPQQHLSEKTAAGRNMVKINQWRKNKNFTFKVTPNHLMNYDFEEFKRTKMGRKRGHKQIKSDQLYPTYQEYFLNTPVLEELPTNMDWRTRGVMPAVKDQLFCGDCWAFSAMGTVESHINIARLNNPKQSYFNSVPLVSLSEQWLTDCFWDENPTEGWEGCEGCDGGDEDEALYNMVGQTVFTAEHAYPFLGHNDWCKKNLTNVTGFNVTAWHRVPYNNIIQMKRAVMNGPVAIGIAVAESMVFYAGGVYNDPACSSNPEDIDHGVIVIGWGESSYGPYWVVRNSWSPYWGMDGYLYLAMKDNLCAILSDASWVEVAELNATQ